MKNCTYRIIQPLLALLLVFSCLRGNAQDNSFPKEGELKKADSSFYVFDSGQWRKVHTHREYVVDAPDRRQIGLMLFLDSLPIEKERWDSTYQAFLEPEHRVARVIRPLTGPASKADFTGTWVLMHNGQKMISGELYRYSVPKQVSIRQTPAFIRIESVNGSDIGDITTADSYTLDGQAMEKQRTGKETIVTVLSRNTSRSAFTLSSLVYTADHRPEYRFTEVWALVTTGGWQKLVLKKENESLLYPAPAWVCRATYEKQK
jgi:hypothetical protein